MQRSDQSAPCLLCSFGVGVSGHWSNAWQQVLCQFCAHTLFSWAGNSKHLLTLHSKLHFFFFLIFSHANSTSVGSMWELKLIVSYFFPQYQTEESLWYSAFTRLPDVLCLYEYFPFQGGFYCAVCPWWAAGPACQHMLPSRGCFC